jgi:hypothetical protein
MKVICSILLFLNLTVYYSQLSFTVVPLSNSTEITCYLTSLNFTATSNYTAPVSYAWTNGTFSQTGSSVNISSPGVYSIMASAVNATVFQSLTVSINTIQPQFTVTVPKWVLDCNTPSVILSASSSNTSTSFYWNFPGIGQTFQPTVVVIANAPVTSTVAKIFTLTVTDFLNGCKSMTVVPIYQILFPPIPIMNNPSGQQPCYKDSVYLLNQSTSTIPPFFSPTAPVVAVWGPLGSSTTTAFSQTYVTGSPGVYSMTVTDLNNGCKSVANTGFCVGIQNNNDLNKEISIFPNPNGGLLNISSSPGKEKSFEIISLQGSVLKSGFLHDNLNLIDLTGIHNGIYILMITDDEKILLRSKIIKR